MSETLFERVKRLQVEQERVSKQLREIGLSRNGYKETIKILHAFQRDNLNKKYKGMEVSEKIHGFFSDIATVYSFLEESSDYLEDPAEKVKNLSKFDGLECELITALSRASDWIVGITAKPFDLFSGWRLREEVRGGGSDIEKFADLIHDYDLSHLPFEQLVTNMVDNGGTSHNGRRCDEDKMSFLERLLSVYDPYNRGKPRDKKNLFASITDFPEDLSAEGIARRVYFLAKSEMVDEKDLTSGNLNLSRHQLLSVLRQLGFDSDFLYHTKWLGVKELEKDLQTPERCQVAQKAVSALSKISIPFEDYKRKDFLKREVDPRTAYCSWLINLTRDYFPRFDYFVRSYLSVRKEEEYIEKSLTKTVFDSSKGILEDYSNFIDFASWLTEKFESSAPQHTP